MYFGFFELHSCDERSVVRRRRFIQCFRREGLVPPLRRAFLRRVAADSMSLAGRK